jgi:hypothetical protein
MSISLRCHPILSGEAALGAYDISRMDEARRIRAAQTTRRREIFKHFPPGPERQNRLNWFAEACIAGAGGRYAPATPVLYGVRPSIEFVRIATLVENARG